MSKPIEFGKWQPDFGIRRAQIYEAQNLIYYDGKYFPFYGLKTNGGVLSGTPTGIAVYQDKTQITNFIFTSSKIYREIGGVRTDVSQSGDYSGNYASPWSHTVYGDTLIATNYGVDNIQVMADYANASAFSDLGGSPPKANVICVYKDFLFLGNVDEGGIAYPRRLWRSAQGNLSDWSPNNDTGCGYQDLPSWGDEIVALKTLGDQLVVYCTNSIWFTYEVGSPYWFGYRKVAEVPGPLSAAAVVEIDNDNHIVLSRDDVYVVNSGGSVTSVGAGVKRSALVDLDINVAQRVSGVVDTEKKIAMWCFCTTTASDKIPDKILLYNYAEDAFTYASYKLNCVGKVVSQGITINNMDQFGTIDNLPNYPVDNSFWSGGSYKLGGISSDGYVASFSGATLDGIIVPSEVFIDDMMMLITRVRPLYELGESQATVPSFSLSVYRRNDQITQYSTPTVYSPRSDGRFDVRSTGRYQLIQFNVTGEHNGLTGFVLDCKEVGRR